MKKLINDAYAVTTEALEGMCMANRESIRKLPDCNVIVKRELPPPGQVRVVIGGGSGHEPFRLLIGVSGACNLYLGKQSVCLEETGVYCFQKPQERCFVADATAELELYLLGISGIEVLNPYMETACREQKPVEIYEEDRPIFLRSFEKR